MIGFLMSQQSVAKTKGFMLQQRFLCRNRIGQGQNKLCHDRTFYVTTAFWPRLKGSLVATEYFYVVTEFVLDMIF